MRMHCTCLAAVAVLAMATPAEAVRITGTFTYPDERDGHRFPREIAGALVEVVQNGVVVAVLVTDLTGSVDEVVPAFGGTFALNVYATNLAVTVLEEPTGPWSAQPGEATPIWRSSSSSSDVLDFDHNFVTSDAVARFNIAETIRHGFAFVAARRAPGETDILPQVKVSISWPENAWGTRYNLPTKSLLYNRSAVQPTTEGRLNDFVILHEYAHFVTDMISRYLVIPTYHTGCVSYDWLGSIINTPENTWPEAFAAWFARVVPLVVPSAQLSGFDNVLSPSDERLEDPGACGAIGMLTIGGDVIRGDAVEDYVQAVLWDLTDLPIDGSLGGWNRDFVAGNETVIFQIFDRDLDGPEWPNMRRFHDAWVARGLDHAALDRIMAPLMPELVTDANNTIVDRNRSYLDDNGFGTSPGTPVIVWGATTGDNQQWSFEGGQLRNHAGPDLCMNANPLAEIQACSSALPTAQWGFHGQIRAADGKCLESIGTQLVASTCRNPPNNASQLWAFDGGAIRQVWWCLEPGYQQIDVVPCTGKSYQRWSRGEQGQLVDARGGCLGMGPAASEVTVPYSEETPVFAQTCVIESHLQRWQLAGEITHEADGKCLSGGTGWGVQQKATACTGSPDQVWTYFADAR